MQQQITLGMTHFQDRSLLTRARRTLSSVELFSLPRLQRLFALGTLLIVPCAPRNARSGTLSTPPRRSYCQHCWEPCRAARRHTDAAARSRAL